MSNSLRIPMAFVGAALAAAFFAGSSAQGDDAPPLTAPGTSATAPAGPAATPAPIPTSPSAANVPAPAADVPSPACRVEVIPAHTREVTRQVTHPPVVGERQVPVYAQVDVPTYETRQVPVYETVQVPTYATREVPVYDTVREPVWGEAEVPTFRKVEKPVEIDLWNPFGCDDLTVKLWDTTECVPCGTATQSAVVGWQEHQVQTGTRTESYVSGTTAQQVLTGYRTETTQTGTHPETRQSGWKTESVVLAPARVETVTDRVAVPCERVTVVPDDQLASAVPLPGTTRVIGETELVQTLATAR